MKKGDHVWCFPHGRGKTVAYGVVQFPPDEDGNVYVYSEGIGLRMYPPSCVDYRTDVPQVDSGTTPPAGMVRMNGRSGDWVHPDGCPKVAGVGKDAPVATNALGGKQSASPYRTDLLPPKAVLEVAKVLKHGADRYEPNNWRKITVAEHLNHALVHVLAWLAGDRQDDHLGHFACRSLMALEIELVGTTTSAEPDKDDILGDPR